MIELEISEQEKVCGGIVPMAAIGYFVGGTAFGMGASALAIWIAKRL